MIFLSNAAVKYAVNICLEESRYKVLIVTETQRQIDTVAIQIMDLLINREYRPVHAAGSRRFDFDNGSKIQIVSTGDMFHGERVNLVVADLAIERDALDRVRGLELNDWGRYNAYHAPEFPW